MGKKRGYIKPKQVNPALKEMNLRRRINEEVEAATISGIRYGILATRIITLMVFHDNKTFTPEELNNKVAEIANATLNTYTTLPDLVNTMHDVYGLTMTVDEIANADGTLAAYLATGEKNDAESVEAEDTTAPSEATYEKGEEMLPQS